MAITLLVRGPIRIRLARFTVASAIATGISQLVLLSVYWVGLTDAAAASTLAFLAGSVPHFLMVRYWAWRDTDPGRLPQQLTTYFTVTLVGGVVSIALTTLAEHLLLPLVSGQGWQAVVLTLSYLAASGPVFLLKFALFDRAFAARGSAGEPADQLGQGARGEPGRAGGHLVVVPLRPGRASDVEVRPRQAGGELPQEHRRGDPARSGWALPDVGDVAAHGSANSSSTEPASVDSGMRHQRSPARSPASITRPATSSAVANTPPVRSPSETFIAPVSVATSTSRSGESRSAA